jgi:hypothetical protein
MFLALSITRETLLRAQADTIPELIQELGTYIYVHRLTLHSDYFIGCGYKSNSFMIIIKGFTGKKISILLWQMLSCCTRKLQDAYAGKIFYTCTCQFTHIYKYAYVSIYVCRYKNMKTARYES